MGRAVRVSPVLLLLFATSPAALVFAQTSQNLGPANVLVVVNDASPLSKNIGQYYVQRRAIPLENVCHIRTTSMEEIPRNQYDKEIAAPVAKCLTAKKLTEQVFYIATTAGVPLRVAGVEAQDGDVAAVDSELALLYLDRQNGHPHALKGGIQNPMFNRRFAPMSHSQFPMYLVTRLAAYDFNTVKKMIDGCMEASNRGKFVFDTRGPEEAPGDSWLREAASLLPKDRVVLENSTNVLYDQTDVIGYASWGSNDRSRHQRLDGFHWLPGAIAAEFVSTDARTFAKPPDTWNISAWETPKLFFAGSPQSMTADFLLEGASAATGHVAEPYLDMTPHPELLFPTYFAGRNLAESFYVSIRLLSWQNIVAGDPLCSIGPPAGK